MWVATLALNGLIGAGAPQDWATHMIGHELTAAHGIDHARTLAIVLPSLLKVQRKDKHAKLLQYATRVWGINDGDEAQRVETRLSDYGWKADAIDELVAHLEAHGMTALDEHRNVSLDVSRRILEGAL
jgi:NADP-dependent alcohol dehydrogenase